MDTKKIGIITTINTNIGDDFIREGVLNLLREVFSNYRLKIVLINKHKPYTIYHYWNPLRILNSIEKLNFRGKKNVVDVIKKLGTKKINRFSSCDLIVQSGAPVIWENCHSCEWNEPIWQDVVRVLKAKIPVWNLAAGSCFPYENPNIKLNNKDETYIKQISSYCDLTICRDQLALGKFNVYNETVKLMPCTAFFVSKTSSSFLGDKILINYMEGGGHFDWGQNIDKARWENTIKAVIKKLKKQYKVAFLCHNQSEVDITSKLDREIEVYFPKTPKSYIEVCKSAAIGINNRMHACVAQASLGVPSIGIGTDTRMCMLEQIGIKTMFVNNVNEFNLIEEFNKLISIRHEESHRLLCLKKNSYLEYRDLLNVAWKNNTRVKN